jgi:epoxyqueuosine reductase
VARSADIIAACRAMGFADAGIAPSRPAAYRQEFLDWLAAGKHGEMAYLAELLEERLDIGVMLPGARSVIIVADRYATGGPDAPHPTDQPFGRIARYARGDDYHRRIKKRLHTLADRLRRLHPGAEFRAFVDTGPVLEREHAARAGLGFIGKHTLLIHPLLGSYLLLGGVATTLELDPTGPDEPPESRCGTCTRCIDACPTSAITPFSVDARRCISYLTLEHSGPVADDLADSCGDHLIGCDICQEVCPYNAPAPGDERMNPAYAGDHAPGRALPLLDVLHWSESDRSRVLGRSAARRATLDMLKRSAVIALVNHWRVTGDPRVPPTLERLAERADLPASVRAAVIRGLSACRSRVPPRDRSSSAPGPLAEP